MGHSRKNVDSDLRNVHRIRIHCILDTFNQLFPICCSLIVHALLNQARIE